MRPVPAPTQQGEQEGMDSIFRPSWLFGSSSTRRECAAVLCIDAWSTSDAHFAMVLLLFPLGCAHLCLRMLHTKITPPPTFAQYNACFAVIAARTQYSAFTDEKKSEFAAKLGWTRVETDVFFRRLHEVLEQT